MRKVSIVGDSISTCEGFQPEGYAVFYDRATQAAHGLAGVYDTWWAQVNQALHACLCVNNSYSGSRVTGDCFPSAAAGQRMQCLHNGAGQPDLILIYIGFNDFGSGVRVWRRGWDRLLRRGERPFFDAYEEMLSQIRRNYPHAAVVCATLMRTAIAGKEGWSFPEDFAGVRLEDYNQAIRAACRRKRCYLADIAALGLRYETLDGSHPTAAGHRTLAGAWRYCLGAAGLLPAGGR